MFEESEMPRITQEIYAAGKGNLIVRGVYGRLPPTSVLCFLGSLDMLKSFIIGKIKLDYELDNIQPIGHKKRCFKDLTGEISKRLTEEGQRLTWKEKDKYYYFW